MDTLKGTHLHNVECNNNELTSNGNKIGTVTDDGVLSPNGEKLEFFLRGPTPPDIPITFNRDCQMIYNNGMFNDDGTPVEVSTEHKSRAIYLKTQTTGGKKRRSSHKKRRSSHKKRRSSHKKRRSSHRRH